MANNNSRLSPVKLSSLPEVPTPDGFWLFGSKEEKDGSMTSGRYGLDNLLEFAQKMQLERRLTFSIESDLYPTVYIDEAMTIYRIGAKNVSGVTIGIEGEDHSLPLDTDISVEVPAKSVLSIKATPSAADVKTRYLFIYAKAKMI